MHSSFLQMEYNGKCDKIGINLWKSDKSGEFVWISRKKKF